MCHFFVLVWILAFLKQRPEEQSIIDWSRMLQLWALSTSLSETFLLVISENQDRADHYLMKIILASVFPRMNYLKKLKMKSSMKLSVWARLHQNIGEYLTFSQRLYYMSYNEILKFRLIKQWFIVALAHPLKHLVKKGINMSI